MQRITVTIKIEGVLTPLTHKSNKFPGVIAEAELATSLDSRALVISLPLQKGFIRNFVTYEQRSNLLIDRTFAFKCCLPYIKYNGSLFVINLTT